MRSVLKALGQRLILVAFLFTNVFTFAPATAATATTVTFREGVNNYVGTKDLAITNQYADTWNSGNGNTYPYGDMGVYQATGHETYESRPLIRFDNLSLPVGAKVTAAALTVTFVDWEGGSSISGYYLNTPWNDIGVKEGAYVNQIGWIKRNATDSWAVPGAGGADLVSNKTLPVITDLKAGGYETRIIPLDTTIVQSWVDNTAANNGVILVNQNAGPRPRIMSSDNVTIAYRPMLSITYEVGDSNPPPPPAPAIIAPSNAVATPVSATAIKVTWKDNSANETNFVLERKTEVNGSYTVVTTTRARVQAYTDKGLSKNILYTYRIRAINKTDVSEYSNETSATIPSVPAAPSNLSAKAVSGTQVDLAWQDNSNNEDSFRVQRKVAGGVYARIAIVPANITNYSDTTTLPSTTYYYNVRSVNVSGGSAYSNAVKIVTPSTDVPPPPPADTTAPIVSITAPVANATVSGSITISADATDNVGVSGVSFFVDGTQVGAEDTTSGYSATLDTTSLTNGSHSLTASARDAAGNVGLSAVVTINVNNQTIKPPSPAPVAGHPRLLLRANDIPRLRSWAVPNNPVYSQLMKQVNLAKSLMDQGKTPNNDGSNNAVLYPVELHAELFAFMSMIAPTQAERDDYGNRARTLFMHVINQAALGSADGQPYRDPYFSTGNRSRWCGESFGLTVDWAYPYFTAADKATIKKVFLRWIDENIHAVTTGNNHPEPIGVTNDPVLLKDADRVRWAGNNYFLAHMRNIGFMSMAMDPTDDLDGALRGYLKNATGAWLYMADHLFKNDARGGLPAEGFEYSPQAMGYLAEFLLALNTAGENDPAKWGNQVRFENTTWWQYSLDGFLHSINPGNAKLPADPNDAWTGVQFQPANYGDLSHYVVPDMIGVYGPLALYDYYNGNTSRLPTLKWIIKNASTGGADKMIYRMDDIGGFYTAIRYFMVFDPNAPEPADPRGSQPLDFFAPGLGRIMSRTDWTQNANWFTYKLGWNSVDHQHGDGNMFEFWRKGEWLTKEQSGYGFIVGSSDAKNSLSVENDKPYHNDYRGTLWEHGSQWIYVADGDGKILAKSMTPEYIYALGDATALHNSTYELSTDVTHVSRSIMWLKPDHIVVYDRAATKTNNRFKRFFLNLPFNATVSGKQMTMTTAAGQKLFATTLLPSTATPVVIPADLTESASSDPIRYRLKVEAPGGPNSARFLHVIQGADAGSAADATSLVQSTAGTPFSGAVVKNSVVMFPVDITSNVSTVTFDVPSTVTAFYVTGLTPNAKYTVSASANGGTTQIIITAGGTLTADGGGVLRW